MDTLLEIPLDQIVPDPDQPRKHFDQAALDQLIESIKVSGVHQPITIRLHPDQNVAQYMIVTGERRYRASTTLGRETIPCILREYTEDSLFAEQFLENIDSEGLNPLEIATSIQAQLDRYELQGYEYPSKKFLEVTGKNKAWLSKKLSVLKLPGDMRDLFTKGLIRDYSIIKKVNGLKGEKRQEAITLIQNQEFNSKEFFKRRRYDNKKPADTNKTENGINSSLAPGPENKNNPPGRFVLRVPSPTLVRLIDATEYKYTLDTVTPGWRHDPSMHKKISKDFEAWLNRETEQPEANTEEKHVTQPEFA